MTARLLLGAGFSVTGEAAYDAWGATFGLPSHAVPAASGRGIHLANRTPEPVVVGSENRTERTHVLDWDDVCEVDIVLGEIFVWGV